MCLKVVFIDVFWYGFVSICFLYGFHRCVLIWSCFYMSSIWLFVDPSQYGLVLGPVVDCHGVPEFHLWGDGLPGVQLLPLQDTASVALQVVFSGANFGDLEIPNPFPMKWGAFGKCKWSFYWIEIHNDKPYHDNRDTIFYHDLSYTIIIIHNKVHHGICCSSRGIAALPRRHRKFGTFFSRRCPLLFGKNHDTFGYLGKNH